MTTEPDRYDPTGAAAIWDRAAELVSAMRDPELPIDWNTAIEQAAHALNDGSRAGEGTGLTS